MIRDCVLIFGAALLGWSGSTYFRIDSAIPILEQCQRDQADLGRVLASIQARCPSEAVLVNPGDIMDALSGLEPGE